ncbi:hypothetical protein ACL02U_04115 [Streptomyces sp. MS06]|uniref:hypothetical protein n=1 Tax=Streptomyces sp. MS06 TaxID=3385974 RepID=UPI0039A20C87
MTAPTTPSTTTPSTTVAPAAGGGPTEAEARPAAAPAVPPAADTAHRRTAGGAAPDHPGPGTWVKLRPGAHLAPVSRGVHLSHGRRSFVLGGPPALFTLLDRHLGPLSDGTCLDELVAAEGTEESRPVLARILRALLDQGVLLDLDAMGTPEPDPGTAERYADVLAFLEDHSDDPYGVFAVLRSATVDVRGAGPAVPALLRGLAVHGVERVRVLPGIAPAEGSAPDVTVLVADADAGVPAPVEADADGCTDGVTDARGPGGSAEADVWRAASAAGHPVVVVVARPDLAAVATPGPRGGSADPAAALRRAAAWAALEPAGWTPRPMSAVLAGALAARACVEVLTGIGTSPPDGSGTSPGEPPADQVSGHSPGVAPSPPAAAPHLTLVWGHALESRRIPLTGPDGVRPAAPDGGEAVDPTEKSTEKSTEKPTEEGGGGPDGRADGGGADDRAAGDASDDRVGIRSGSHDRTETGPDGIGRTPVTGTAPPSGPRPTSAERMPVPSEGEPDRGGRRGAPEGSGGGPAAGRWRRVDAGALLADLADGRAPAPDPTGAYAASGPLTARWTGPARFERDLDVEQVPVSVASVRWIDSGRTTLGWGPSRAVAGVQALLDGLRSVVVPGTHPAGSGGPVACAGATEHQWLLDGLLRLAPVPHRDAPGAEPVDWDSVTHPEVQALWGALLDHFEQPVRLDVRRIPPLGWWVATAVRDADGAVLGRQWGPGRESAVHAALVECCARVQSGGRWTPERGDAPGTWVLHSLAPQRAAALARGGAALGGTLTAHRLTGDGVLPGRLLPCGLLELR